MTKYTPTAVTWIFGGNHRLAILAVGVYFVIGLLLLTGIDVERGRRAALDVTA
jgi:UMF1 family MFS transporter